MCARRTSVEACLLGAFFVEGGCKLERQKQGRKLDSPAESKGKSERGFALLSVLIAVLIMGTMVTVAVPKFTAALASANTTKIQADLAAIDTAIALYSIDKGTLPTTIGQLRDYLENADKIKPPTGKCNVNGATVAVPGTEYSIANNDGSMQARLGNYSAYDFGSKSGSTTNSTGGTDSSGAKP